MHLPGHQPQWGLGGRPNRSTFGGLLTTPMQFPVDVESLSDETEEERKLRLAKEAAQRKKVTGAVGRVVGQLGGDMMKAYGRQEWKPMMNLGMGRQQYGGRRRRYA